MTTITCEYFYVAFRKKSQRPAIDLFDIYQKFCSLTRKFSQKLRTDKVFSMPIQRTQNHKSKGFMQPCSSAKYFLPNSKIFDPLLQWTQKAIFTAMIRCHINWQTLEPCIQIRWKRAYERKAHKNTDMKTNTSSWFTRQIKNYPLVLEYIAYQRQFQRDIQTSFSNRF